MFKKIIWGFMLVGVLVHPFFDFTSCKRFEYPEPSKALAMNVESAALGYSWKLNVECLWPWVSPFPSAGDIAELILSGFIASGCAASYEIMPDGSVQMTAEKNQVVFTMEIREIFSCEWEIKTLCLDEYIGEFVTQTIEKMLTDYRR